MKENDIARIVSRFEKLIGPVARAIAEEAAAELNILRAGNVSPQSQGEYVSFMKRLSERYSKILGKPLVEKMMSEMG